MDLFKIVKGNRLEIDDVNVLLVKEFTDIYRRDRTPTKEIAFEELKYVQLICSPNSPYVKQGINGEELHDKVIKNLTLGKDWQPDDLIRTAISFYKREINGIATRLLISILESFNTADKLINKLNAINKRELERENLTDDQVDIILKRQNLIIDTGSKLPVQIEKLNKAVEQSKLEIKKKVRTKGGGELEASMVVSNDN